MRLGLPLALAITALVGCGSKSALSHGIAADAAPDSATDTSPEDTAAPDTRPLPDTAPDPSDIGDRCVGPVDCRSAGDVVDVPACIAAGAMWRNGALWTNGYCTAQCTPSTIPGEDALARDDCPEDAVCVRVDRIAGESVEGIGVCLLACIDDGDCREDYSCRREFLGADAPLMVGACMSSHCLSRGCISSARCDC